MDSLRMIGCAIVISGVIIWWYIRKKYSYWRERKILYLEPTIPYGNIKELSKTVHATEFYRDMYIQYKNKGDILGLYYYLEPVGVILNLDLAKQILIKDFAYFRDKNKYYNEGHDPLSAHVGHLNGDKWHLARHKLSPTFTSARLKKMFPLVRNVSKVLVDVLDSYSSNGTPVKMKQVANNFITDAVSQIIYGIECNTLRDTVGQYRLMMKEQFTRQRHPPFVRVFMDCYPYLADLLKFKVVPDDISEFYLKIIRDTISSRERNGAQRNDFMDLLIQLKNTGTLEGHTGKLGKLTENEIAAQAFVFFSSGVTTSSTTLGFALYEMAMNPEIQERARQEIFSVLKDDGDELTYDSLSKMKYVHQIIDETLRKHPLICCLFRKVVQDYRIPNTDQVITKGTEIHVPISGFHYDPDIYPNPEQFNPDNFTPEAIAKRHTCSFMPFGDGPRNCIGTRLGKLLVIMGLTTVLAEFHIGTTEKTPKSLKLVTDERNVEAAQEYFLKLERIK